MAGGGVDLEIACADERWRARLPDVEEVCRRAAAAAFDRAWAPRREAEVSLLLTGDAAVRRLNREFRGQDTPTNVLSFPLCDLAPDAPAPQPPPGLALALGDVALAFETTAAEAARDGKPLADHLCHLVVHGILHLMGYDHQADDDARLMEAVETRILADLGVADPYADLEG